MLQFGGIIPERGEVGNISVRHCNKTALFVTKRGPLQRVDTAEFADNAIDDDNHLLNALLHAAAQPVSENFDKHAHQGGNLIGVLKAVGGNDEIYTGYDLVLQKRGQQVGQIVILDAFHQAAVLLAEDKIAADKKGEVLLLSAAVGQPKF